jgi:hypothetical protein
MKLTSIAEVCRDFEKTPRICSDCKSLPHDLPAEYMELLAKTNGGFTEDRYYHFFGIEGTEYHNVFEWNKPQSWKQHFGLTDSHFVFSEDLFGNQYFFKRGQRKNAIYILWVSTGKTDFIADTFETFIHDIVDDTLEEVMSDFKDLARAFIIKSNSEWIPFKHISHKIPLVLSGKDELDNLEWSDSLTNLFFHGQLISQLKHLPPGTPVKDIIMNKEKREVQIVF